jgi:hypothetical protein
MAHGQRAFALRDSTGLRGITMILRRLVDHFRHQEWTAIALAFLIVVFGVFFGIQVSNWNASRLDERHAHGYLACIHGELNQSPRAS